jgi:hypothetical protein
VGHLRTRPARRADLRHDGKLSRAFGLILCVMGCASAADGPRSAGSEESGGRNERPQLVQPSELAATVQAATEAGTCAGEDQRLSSGPATLSYAQHTQYTCPTGADRSCPPRPHGAMSPGPSSSPSRVRITYTCAVCITRPHPSASSASPREPHTTTARFRNVSRHVAVVVRGGERVVQYRRTMTCMHHASFGCAPRTHQGQTAVPAVPCGKPSRGVRGELLDAVNVSRARQCFYPQQRFTAEPANTV